MSAPVIDLKLRFRPGFQAEMDKGFQKVQYAFSQQVAKAVDPYVPFDTGTLKNSVNQASDFKGGKLIYNTPYARRQYYLHTQGQGLHGENHLRGSYWASGPLLTTKTNWSSSPKTLPKRSWEVERNAQSIHHSPAGLAQDLPAHCRRAGCHRCGLPHCRLEEEATAFPLRTAPPTPL